MSPLPAPQAVNKRQTTLFSDIDANLASVKNAIALRRRIRFQRVAGKQEIEVMLSKYQPPPKDDTDENGNGDESGVKEEEDIREASVLHINTNVIIFQEFVLGIQVYP